MKYTLQDNLTAETYKNTPINFFGKGYTVFYDGDELYFDSLQDAKNFIDEMLTAAFKTVNEFYGR